MSRPDDYEDEPETFRSAPHPDDRLWRHPSEIAAMHAAQTAHANAETTQVPIISVQAPSRSRLPFGLAAAAGVIVIGAAALTLGFATSQSAGPSTNATEVMPVVSSTRDAPRTSAAAAIEEVSAAPSTRAEDAFTERLHEIVAPSISRIQATTTSGMREGSGLFVTDNGHIATSATLIADAEYVVAWTDDGQRWKAHVLASDYVSDIAIIQIDSVDWPAVTLSTSIDVRAGQYALTLDHDTRNISLGEVVTADEILVGIDQPAAVPGSAIVDDTGSVIAVVIADGTNRHATRAWMLEQVTVDLISSGTTTHTWLGVHSQLTSASNGVVPDAVVVGAVVDGSPAHAAGLLRGDVIDSFNGVSTPDIASLYHEVESTDPGDEAVLTVIRDGSRRIIIATIDELPTGS